MATLFSYRRLTALALGCLAVGASRPAHAWLTWDIGKWPGNVMPWHYNPAGEPAAVLGGPHVGGIPSAILQGAATWTQDRDNSFIDLPQGLVPDEDDNPCGDDTDGDGVIDSLHPDGLNVIGWGNVDALAVTFGIGAGGVITEVDMCFNPYVLWQPGPMLATRAAADVDLETVALHEFGHAVGLDHSDEAIGGRDVVDYAKTVMSGLGLPEGTNTRDLFCDDQSGADFIYTPGPPKHPPEPGATEYRDLSLAHDGGCDFGDAPDPFNGFGFYPSLEGPFSPPLSVSPPDPDDALGPLARNRVSGLGDPTILAPIFPGARHKDCSMEWLGPMPSPFPLKHRPIPGTAATRCRSQLAVPNQAVTFEPESRQTDLDELDDGISVVQTGLATFTVRVFVNTSGLGGARYVAADPDERLYLHGWEDWNCDGDWDDPGEHPIFWTGTPTADVAASATFVPPGVAMGTGRLLRFDIVAPPGFEPPCAERFRVDYAENAGLNPRPWTKANKFSRSFVGVIPQAPDLTRGTLKYGEVEDYTFGDHYLCYKAKDRVRRTFPVINLIDQFFSAAYRPVRPGLLCTPASKERRPIVDPVTHLKGYGLDKLAGDHLQPTVDVQNQFGTQRLHVVKESGLFVPTSKAIGEEPEPPDPDLPGFEHYKCYRVTSRDPFPKNILVEVEDQFGAGKYRVRKAQRLCNPAEKRTVGGPVEPIANPLRHLVCYGLRPLSRIIPPPEVETNNQFGRETLSMSREKELCVPSLKVVVGSPSGAFL